MATAFEETDANDELWRKCATWLTRWEMLRTDHKANWPQACIADLANILRDGVLLCKLLNKLDPGCLDMKEVSLKPTMAQFLCLRNINLFLKTCVDNFGLKHSDLFDDTMLFDLTNFHKVLCTLSKLSLSPKTLRGRVPGFVAQRLKSREDEVIYQSLKNVDIRYNSGVNCSEPSWLQFKIPCPQPEDWEEEIYDDLCYVTFSSSFPEQPPTFEKRDFVIKELLDTEKNYVDVLSKLKNNFMQPLMCQMKPDDHNTVFFKIKELRDIHSEFLHELLRIKNNPTVKLSNIFMRFREKFLLYGMYCANLTKATTLLQELCDSEEIFNQAIIKYEKEDNNGRFKLRDVLSVPMQRILKYHLLLDKLIENTDPNHEEYNDLRRAREAMLDVAGYINEAAKDSEHLEVINNLQETITECEFQEQRLSDFGRLMKDAELRIKAHHDQKIKNRYVFIFDKCILICKQLKGHQFAFRGLINIADYHIEEIHNRPILNKEARWSYQFYLVKNDSENVYNIFVKSIELKQQIIKAITDALDNLHPKTMQRTSHNFELQTFPSPVQCHHCSKYLKGLIYQGYKCNKCHIAVHKSCIQYSGRCGQSPLHVNTGLLNGVNGDPMSEKLWFVGEMDRTTATAKLEKRENGTYLVRIRPQNDQNGQYALTLKTDNTVKHMKICCMNDVSSNSKKYFLSRSKFFSSIEELVLNYQNYSLRENFERLEEDTKLLWPFKQLKAMTVKHYEAGDAHQLRVNEGEALIIVGLEGYRDGWWKARKENNETGFVPMVILRVEGELDFET